VGVLNVRPKVFFPSTASLSMMGTVKVFDVSPPAKVSVPDVAVYLLPALPVLLLVA